MIKDLFTERTDKNTNNSENKVEIIDVETKSFTNKYLSLWKIFENENKKIQNCFRESNFNVREISQENHIYENNKKYNLNSIINNHNIEKEKKYQSKTYSKDNLQGFQIKENKKLIINNENNKYYLVNENNNIFNFIILNNKDKD